MRKEAAVFLTAMIVISLIGVAMSVIGVSMAVMAKDIKKPTAHNYKQGRGYCMVQGCSCKLFDPSPFSTPGYAPWCANCGHKWSQHAG